MSKAKAGPSHQSKTLQALIICDSFSNEFGAPADRLPEILFPICNAPLLHYSLEFLVSQPVSQIFVISCNRSDLVSQYIQFVNFLFSLSFFFSFFSENLSGEAGKHLPLNFTNSTMLILLHNVFRELRRWISLPVISYFAWAALFQM